MRERSSFQATNLGPIKSRLHEMFRGDVPKPLAIVSCLYLAMIYKQRYCSFRGDYPNHLSSQNLTWNPTLIVKDPKPRKSCFRCTKFFPAS